MKQMNHLALVVIAALVLQSCAGTRNSTSTAGPSGPITPATGSASNIAAGRNTAAAPVSGSQGGIAATSSGVTTDTGVTGETGANNGTRASSASIGTTTNVTAANQNPAVTSESDKSGKAKDSPEYFMSKAAVMGMTDVRLSQYALSKSANTSIKAFAAMVVKEHGDANNELKSLAAAKSFTLPNPDSLGTDSEIKMKSMSAASTADFDGEYIEMMIADHETAIDLFEQGAKSKDPEVKAFAKKYLPILKIHLKSVKSFIGN